MHIAASVSTTDGQIPLTAILSVFLDFLIAGLSGRNGARRRGLFKFRFRRRENVLEKNILPPQNRGEFPNKLGQQLGGQLSVVSQHGFQRSSLSLLHFSSKNSLGGGGEPTDRVLHL
uniref:Uncharacterized protein n=1 Tax=Eutreptiella gymnastica TaxID=73025 RepID=A0A6T2CJF9_9EUGL